MSKGKHQDPTPDVVDVILYYFDEGKWFTQEPQPRPIRFHIIGKTMGSARWRPHLIQHKDPLPPMRKKKEYDGMLEILREGISHQVSLDCATITKDLLDDISGEDE